MSTGNFNRQTTTTSKKTYFLINKNELISVYLLLLLFNRTEFSHHKVNKMYIHFASGTLHPASSIHKDKWYWIRNVFFWCIHEALLQNMFFFLYSVLFHLNEQKCVHSTLYSKQRQNRQQILITKCRIYENLCGLSSNNSHQD